MRQEQFRIPADGAVHTLSFSGEMVAVDHVLGQQPLFLHAEADAVTFSATSDGAQPVDRFFQVVGSGQPSPPGARFIETVLVPCEELRWWHLFEVTAP